MNFNKEDIMKIEILNLKNVNNIEINRYPDKCPFCHKSIHPSLITGLYRKGSMDLQQLEVVFRCPSNDCQRIFISYYYNVQSLYGRISNYYLQATMFGELEPLKFSDTIQDRKSVV